mmetsp:Transcript_18261/g.47705  ORF Transcript_18261/g.47705 Transcript_18261/m.47705 type:complete len:709 (+) Transcript_18261:104-2230(+)
MAAAVGAVGVQMHSELSKRRMSPRPRPQRSPSTGALLAPSRGCPPPPNDSAGGGVPALSAAVTFLQTQIDTAILARGAVHARSWKFPTACAAEIDVHSAVDRFSFVGPDPRHAVVARLSLLELVIDRMVLLAETTCAHIGDSADLAECSRCVATAHDHPGDDEGHAAPAHGGVAVVGRLCQQTVSMQEQIDRLQLLLDTKDALLERQDGQIASLVEGADLTPPPVCATSAMTTQTECGPSTSRCDGCAKLLAATATLNDEINRLDLIDRADVGPAGQSPFQCTQLCERFLLGAATHLQQLAIEKAGWLAERDNALRGKREAEAAAATETARADEATAALARAKSAHRDALGKAEAKAADEAARFKREMEQMVARLTTDADTAARAATLKHTEELQSTREEAAARVAKLTKDVLDATQRNSDAATALAASQAEAAAAANELATVRAKEATASHERDVLADQLAALQTRLDSEIAATITARRESAAALGAERTARNAAEQTAAELATSLDAVKKELQAKTSTSAARVEDAERRLAEAEAACAVVDKEVQLLRDEVNECRRTAEDAVKGQAEAEAWLDKAGAERRRLLQKIARLSKSGGHSAGGRSDAANGSSELAARRPSEDPATLDLARVAQTTYAAGQSELAPRPPTGNPISMARSRRGTPNIDARRPDAMPTATSTVAPPSLRSGVTKSDRQAAIRKYLAARASASQ